MHSEVPISPGTSITPATLLMLIHLVSPQEPLTLAKDHSHQIRRKLKSTPCEYRRK